MNRFLTVLAVAALAGVVYVAAAPGSQTAGPTAAQFKALKKQVTGLKKEVKGVEGLAIAEAFLLTDCMKYSIPIDQFGDNSVGSTFGYSYADPDIDGGTPFLTTALDVTASDDPNALWITGGDSQCGTDINGALRKVSRLAGIPMHSAPRVFGTGRR